MMTGLILLIDNEENFLVSTTKCLQEAGYDCKSVTNMHDAAETLKTKSFDLLIANIDIPNNVHLEHTYDLLQIAKGLPAILVTEQPTLETAVAAIKLPVTAYLTKPVQSEDLLNEVSKASKYSRHKKGLANILQKEEKFLQRSMEVVEHVNPFNENNCSDTINAFIVLTYRNIINSLIDIRQLTEGLIKGRQDMYHACHILNCPREILLRKTIIETVEVLEKTRSAFKSKDIGTLRKKLNKILTTEFSNKG